MALQFVGENSAVKAGATSGNSTVSLTALTGGVASSASAGDLVIAVFATGSTANRALTITDGTNNYTLIDAELYSNGTSYDTNLRVAYKYLTAADTSVTFGPTGNNADAGAMAVHVWRNVDSTTPLDVAAVPATNTGTGRPDPAAITPTTSGAVIVVVGAGAAGTGAVYTASYLSGFISETSPDTNDAMVGIGYVTWTSGQYNPAAWTGGTTNAGDSWAAMTIALRPMIRTSSGALTGQGSTIVGSAEKIAASVTHATTGDLTGQIGSVSGSASRFRTFSTSGTLTGQLGSISGSARLNIPHTTSGTLSGQDSSVIGSATRFRTFSTSGTLSGQGSTVTGDADRQSGVVTHVTDGTLVGQDSTISGNATRFRAYNTSGTLTGQDSSIVGDANRYREFSASGVLDGQVASITGDARHNITHATSGELTGQGSSIVGDADHVGLAHDVSGNLVAQGAIIVGKASKPFQEVTGSKNIRPKPSIIVVEVDGKEYRVPALQLQSFLDAIQQKVEDSVPVKKKRKKRSKKTVEVVEVKELPQIVIKSAPVSIIPQIQNRVDEVNTIIANSFSKALQQYIQNIELENVKIEIAKKQAIEDEEEWLLMIL